MNNDEVVNLIGREVLSVLNASVQRGYSLADMFMSLSEIFSVKSARSVKQEVYNIAVDYALQKDCEKGRLPIRFSYVPNLKNNFDHFMLSSDRFCMTHSSIRKPDEFPRNAYIRKDLSVSNQTTLYGEEFIPDLLYGIIVHKPQYRKEGLAAYTALGIPDAEYHKWCNHIPLKQVNTHLVSVTKSEYDDFSLELREISKNSDF